MNTSGIQQSLSELSDSQLVTLYNFFSPTKIDKFSDRTTAEYRMVTYIRERELVPSLEQTSDVYEDLGGGLYIYEIAKHPENMRVMNGSYLPKMLDTDRIELVVKSNPKKGISRDRYACYKDGMTIGEYKREVGRLMGIKQMKIAGNDITHDRKKGYITLQRD